MRYFIAPEFSKKVVGQSEDILPAVSSLIAFIESSEKEDILKKCHVLENGIVAFAVPSHSMRIYATFGSDTEGDYIILMDISVVNRLAAFKNVVSYKNPSTNKTYNPNLNSTINPRLTSTINPRLNSTINPRLNSTINPRLNSTINPRLNSTINPRLNSTINPRLNSTINPRLNSTINPRLNSAYSGPYIYSKELKQQAFIVRANNQVELVFNLNNEFQGISIQANTNNYNIFNTSNEWVSFLVKANNEVRLWFDLQNEWIGLVV